MQNLHAVDEKIVLPLLPGSRALTSDQEMLASGYLISLGLLTVSFGVAAGEILCSADDLFVGDSFQLKNASAILPVLFQEAGQEHVSIHFPAAKVGGAGTTALLVRALTFMSAFGNVVEARVLHGLVGFRDSSFLLLNEYFDPAIEYELIAQTEFDS